MISSSQYSSKKRTVCSTQVLTYHALGKARFRRSLIISTVTHLISTCTPKNDPPNVKKDEIKVHVFRKKRSYVPIFFQPNICKKHVAWKSTWTQKHFGLDKKYFDRRCLTNVVCKCSWKGRWVRHIFYQDEGK